MEPQVQYATSADGTRIAFSTVGRGRPLVMGQGLGWATMEALWSIQKWREGVERLASRRLVVQIDSRGYGLSQREVNDFSLEARVNDLKAVIDRLGVSEVDVLSGRLGAAEAIRYATANPGRVRRLILRNPVARGRDMSYSPLQRALRPLIESEWPTYISTLVLDTFGWEAGSQIAQRAIESVTPETFVASGRAVRDYDVTDLLPGVRCPTLLIHPRSSIINAEVFKHLAAAIPNARVIQFEGESSLNLADEAAVGIIEEFLDADEGPPTEAPPVPSGTAIILFADIADSTPLTERLGDAAFREKARELDGALRAVIGERGGTAIDGKLLGDGVLAVFTSAREAIEAALACGEAGNREGLPLHLGIHAGDVIREDNNVYGGAVNVASRIAGLSAAGEVLVSETVRSLARTSAGVRFEDRGEQELKGVGEAVRVWRVVGAGAT